MISRGIKDEEIDKFSNKLGNSADFTLMIEKLKHLKLEKIISKLQSFDMINKEGKCSFCRARLGLNDTNADNSCCFDFQNCDSHLHDHLLKEIVLRFLNYSLDSENELVKGYHENIAGLTDVATYFITVDFFNKILELECPEEFFLHQNFIINSDLLFELRGSLVNEKYDLLSKPSSSALLSGLVTSRMANRAIRCVDKYIKMFKIIQISQKDIESVNNQYKSDLLVDKVKFINFEHYCGTDLPKWTRSLCNLKKVKISNSKGLIQTLSFSYLKNITELNLSGNDLTSVPLSLNELTKLKKLNLSNNRIQMFKKDLNLTSLECLYLQNNFLWSLAPFNQSLKNLKILDVSNNLFSSLKSITVMKSLTELNVSNNEIVAIPKKISSLKNLSVFLINNNLISKFPQSFFQLKSLKQLKFRNNDVRSISIHFNELINLESFDCRNNPIEYFPDNLLSWL